MDPPMRPAFVEPPCLQTADGRERRIGVEIEFAGLGCREAAELVRRRFEGRVKERDPYRFQVAGTAWGDFLIELDLQYAHRPEAETGEAPGGDAAAASRDLADALEAEIYEAIGDVGSLLAPVEIVMPPVPIRRLPELDVLTEDLRNAGAKGTDEGLLFAFATQLNPEVPSLEPDSIVRHLKAYLLLSEWLRTEIDLDVKRRLLPFVDPFPERYRRKVVDPGYRPDRDRLIDDYLEANRTRNRELDLLPLFAHLDAERVRARIDDPRIKARPTFHYRLPDTRLRDPSWCVVNEWNRWVRVEQLADDEAQLAAAGEEYLARPRGWLSRDWVEAIETLFR